MSNTRTVGINKYLYIVRSIKMVTVAAKMWFPKQNTRNRKMYIKQRTVNYYYNYFAF